MSIRLPHRGVLAAALAVLAMALSLRFHGDAEDMILHLFLNRIHLAHQWAMPYFTPAHCAGFVLAADAQSLLFSVYEPISLLVCNQYLAARLGTALVSVVFYAGFYRWLGLLGVSTAARAVAAAVLALSGFWIAHLSEGHFAFHGIAYLPWILVSVERALALDLRGLSARVRASRVMDVFFPLTFLIFLTLNSGAIWAQLALPLALGRALAELPRLRRRLAAVSVILLSGVVALLLSWPRYGAIFALSSANFPRTIPAYGIFGSWKAAFVAHFRAVFDPRVLVHRLPEPHLGGWWEWTAYMGMLSCPLIILGAFRFLSDARLRYSRPLLGLAFAFFIQLAIIRTGWTTDLLREALPIFRGISYYFRGVLVICFGLAALLALGLDELGRRLDRRSSRAVLVVPWVLGALILGDLALTYRLSGLFGPHEGTYPTASYEIPTRVTELDASSGLAGLSRGVGMRGCYNPPLVGYHAENYRTQTRNGSVLDEVQPGRLNLNDVREIFGPEGRGGRFQKESWPLWPKPDQAELERFLAFEQVVPLPLHLRVANVLSPIALIALLAIAIARAFRKARAA